jgi:hypothetical protein
VVEGGGVLAGGDCLVDAACLPQGDATPGA